MSDESLRTPDHFPDDSQHISLRGAAGDIEAQTSRSEQNTHQATIIICHGVIQNAAHMHNKVVMMMKRAMLEMGVDTVKFSFRGAGASEGEFDQGFGETRDLLTVANWVHTVKPDHQIWLGGYGFGCYVTIRACQKLEVAQLISVSPPVQRFDFASLPEPSCPWLLVQGSDDERVNPEAVYDWAESLENPPQLIRIPGANNGYHRHLMDLRGVLKNGIRRQLIAPPDTSST